MYSFIINKDEVSKAKYINYILKYNSCVFVSSLTVLT